MTDTLSFPPTPAPRVISFARTSDIVHVLNEAEQLDAMIVFTPCDAPRHTYYCASCHVPLATWGQVEMHVDVGGSHHLVRMCRTRGVPEMLDAKEAERLVPFQQLETGL